MHIMSFIMAHKIVQLIVIISILTVLIFKQALTASTPVTWVSDNRFIAGSFLYTPSSSGAINQTITVVYAYSLTATATRFACLGISNFQFFFSTTNFNFELIVASGSITGFQASITTDLGSNIGNLKVCYLIVDPSFTDPFSSSYFSINQSPSVQGPFSLPYYINFTATTGVILNLNNSNAMLAFQHMIRLSSPTKCFQVDIVFRIFNSSFYEVIVSTNCSLQMEKFGFSRIIFDKTAIEALGYCSFQFGQLYATNGNSAPLTFTTNPFFSNGFIIGMKSFNVGGASKLQFSTTISSTTSVTSTIAFTYLKFSYWSLKKRFCPVAFPYFDRQSQMCYDLCPNGYSINNMIYTCKINYNVIRYSNYIPLEIINTDWIGRNSCNNKLYAVLKLQNTALSLASYNSLKFYHPNPLQQNENIIMQSLEYNKQKNQLNITFKYLSDPLTSNVTLILSSTTSQISELIANLELPNYIAPALYSFQQCQTANILQQLIQFMIIASFIIFGFGIFSICRKLIGLELFGVLQLAYFSVIQHYKNINFYISKLAMLAISNGYNEYINDDSIQEYYSLMPQVIKQNIRISGYFISNISIIFFIFGAIIIIFTILYFSLTLYKNLCVSKESKVYPSLSDSNQNFQQNKADTITHAILQKGLISVLKQSMLTLLLFILLNISVSAVVYIKYCIQYADNLTLNALSISSLTLMISALVLILFDFTRKWYDLCGYGQFKLMFKHNILCRLYVPFTIVYRIAISVSIAANIDNLYGTLLPLLICLILVLYHIANLPYASTLHNYRSTTIHITELIIVLVANYYRTMLSNTDLSIKSHKHNAAILVYASLMVCTLFSVSVAIYQILITIKKCISRKKIPQNQAIKKMSQVQVQEYQGNNNESKVNNTNFKESNSNQKQKSKLGLKNLPKNQKRLNKGNQLRSSKLVKIIELNQIQTKKQLSRTKNGINLDQQFEI